MPHSAPIADAPAAVNHTSGYMRPEYVADVREEIFCRNGNPLSALDDIDWRCTEAMTILEAARDVLSGGDSRAATNQALAMLRGAAALLGMTHEPMEIVYDALKGRRSAATGERPSDA
ncbi:MAG TPA: hypothetical protein VGB08_11465 [Allosphingosinicella sp.]|jgi:hypothetical protein